MKKSGIHVTLFLFTLLVTVSCSNVRLKETKSEKAVVKLKIGNSNPNDIGYEKGEETGEVTSVSSICGLGDDLLLLDPIHNNIKIIDIRTRQLKAVSAKTSEVKNWPSDIASFENLIYVASYQDTIFVLDSSYKKVKALKINNPYGEKRFYLNDGKLYVSTYASENWQDEHFDVFATATELGGSAELTVDTIRMGEGHESYLDRLEGFKIKQDDNLTCFTKEEKSFAFSKTF